MKHEPALRVQSYSIWPVTQPGRPDTQTDRPDTQTGRHDINHLIVMLSFGFGFSPQMDAEKMYKVITETPINQYVQPITVGCGHIGGYSIPFAKVTCESESSVKKHKDKSDMKDQVRSFSSTLVVSWLCFDSISSDFYPLLVLSSLNFGLCFRKWNNW